jgi:hypothetical protein
MKLKISYLIHNGLLVNKKNVDKMDIDVHKEMRKETLTLQLYKLLDLSSNWIWWSMNESTVKQFLAKIKPEFGIVKQYSSKEAEEFIWHLESACFNTKYPQCKYLCQKIMEEIQGTPIINEIN